MACRMGNAARTPPSAQIEVRDWTMAGARKDPILSYLIGDLDAGFVAYSTASESHWFPLDLILKRNVALKAAPANMLL